MSREFNMVKFSDEMDILFGELDKAGDNCFEEAKKCYEFVKEEKGRKELAVVAFEMEILCGRLKRFIEGTTDKVGVGCAFGTLMRKVDKCVSEERRAERKAELCNRIEPILRKALEKLGDELMAEILKEFA